MGIYTKITTVRRGRKKSIFRKKRNRRLNAYTVGSVINAFASVYACDIYPSDDTHVQYAIIIIYYVYARCFREPNVMKNKNSDAQTSRAEGSGSGQRTRPPPAEIVS